jgi:two-component system response regulator NreC
MTQSIRVVVIDDHMVLREGLAVLVDAQGDLEIVGQADNLDAARRLIADEKPDVAVIDLALGHDDGLMLVREARQTRAGTRTVVLTMLDGEEHVREALDAGASGYVLKRSSSRNLLDAVRRVVHDEIYLDPTFGPEGMDRILSRPPPADVLAQLTPRERQVLKLVATGFTHREIAEQLGIGKKSVDTYRARVYSKLNIGSRAELVRIAIDSGLLPPPNKN